MANEVGNIDNLLNKKISIEIEGKNVEEAIKKALKTLKLPRNKVKIEVLSEEEKGLFGMPGAKPAKVRVSIK
ncbi:MAG: Jag N-terminal domain-containing protein [Candidatus Omnitrophica bacterium]|nr:Jag N-terminal domain-containing protein [Candidatus Omnitrophota bacterium]